MGQVTQCFNYQAVARFSNGFVISGQEINNLSLHNSVIVTGSSNVSYGSNSLTSDGVNDVLAKLVTWALNDNYIDLNNNSAPTGQGLIDKQTLIDAGNNVSTN